MVTSMVASFIARCRVTVLVHGLDGGLETAKARWKTASTGRFDCVLDANETVLV
jgi:hypothetical protein